jgi:hypothetical protein
LLFGIRHALGLLARLKFVARVIPGANSYREALARELASRPYTFDFLIQRWPDLSELPVWAIEDATKRWTAPWVRAATITIHQQDDIASRDKRAERLSFTPWRVAAEHQPLGSISRARLAIYREMSVFRNKLNEPVPVEVARS